MLGATPPHTKRIRVCLFLLHKPRHSALASASPPFRAYSRTFQSVTGAPPAIPAAFPSPQKARTDAVAYQEDSCVFVFAPQTASQHYRIGVTFLKGAFTNFPVCDRGAASNPGRFSKPPRCSERRRRIPRGFVCVCFYSTNRVTAPSHRRHPPLGRIQELSSL